MNQPVDPVSGNEIPPGGSAEGVRDDIDAQLSAGEIVIPEDVAKYFGVRFFEQLRMEAKQALGGMRNDGRIQGEGGPPQPQQMPPQMAPPQQGMIEELPEEQMFAEGGVVGAAPMMEMYKTPDGTWAFRTQSTGPTARIASSGGYGDVYQNTAVDGGDTSDEEEVVAPVDDGVDAGVGQYGGDRDASDRNPRDSGPMGFDGDLDMSALTDDERAELGEDGPFGFDMPDIAAGALSLGAGLLGGPTAVVSSYKSLTEQAQAVREHEARQAEMRAEATAFGNEHRGDTVKDDDGNAMRASASTNESYSDASGAGSAEDADDNDLETDDDRVGGDYHDEGGDNGGDGSNASGERGPDSEGGRHEGGGRSYAKGGLVTAQPPGMNKKARKKQRKAKKKR